MTQLSNMRTARYWCRGLVLATLLPTLLASCSAPKKIIAVKPKAIPPLAAKVYEAPGVDWAANALFTLELREIGRPDTASNQILERYLSQQVAECLARKGYVRDDASYDTQIRLFFGVKEEKIVSRSTYAYGLSGGASSGYFASQYEVRPGTFWHSSQVGVATWIVRASEHNEPIYRGQITVEVFDRAGTTQLWRGDIEAPLSTNDIRVASQWMIREVLWYLPALDYPPVIVEELAPDRVDQFWDSWIVKRDFCSPGQPFPVRFDYAYYKAPGIVRFKMPGEEVDAQAVKTAEESFMLSHEYLRARDLYIQRTGGKGGFRKSGEYRRAFQGYVFDVWNKRAVTTAAPDMRRYGVAIADLLSTAPWAISAEQQNILIAGRYFVGDDDAVTYIAIEAAPKAVEYAVSQNVVYHFKHYFIKEIRIVSEFSYGSTWKQSRAYRERVFGRMIDQVPPDPTPAERAKVARAKA